MMMPLRLPIRPLIESLNNHPEEWDYDGYTVKHARTGIEIWICNGLFFINLYPDPPGPFFTFIEKIYLHLTIKKLVKNKKRLILNRFDNKVSEGVSKEMLKSLDDYIHKDDLPGEEEIAKISYYAIHPKGYWKVAQGSKVGNECWNVAKAIARRVRGADDA